MHGLILEAIHWIIDNPDAFKAAFELRTNELIDLSKIDLSTTNSQLSKSHGEPLSSESAKTEWETVIHDLKNTDKAIIFQLITNSPSKEKRVVILKGDEITINFEVITQDDLLDKMIGCWMVWQSRQIDNAHKVMANISSLAKQ